MRGDGNEILGDYYGDAETSRQVMEDLEKLTESTETKASSDMVPKERVAELILNAKKSATEKTRLEMEALHQEQLKQLQEMQAQQAQQPQQTTPVTPAQNVGMGGMQGGVDVESIKNQIRDDFAAEKAKEQEERQEEERLLQAKEIAKTFFERVNNADREKYQDFDEATQKIDIGKFPTLVSLATQYDNTSDIFYDLAKDPAKMMQINYYCERDPQYAYHLLGQLSESIKNNDKAVESNKTAKPPLTTMRPSASAGTDSGNLSISDLRKKRSLRG